MNPCGCPTYCHHCGNRIGTLTCGNCGYPCDPRDKHCRDCGDPLRVAISTESVTENTKAQGKAAKKDTTPKTKKPKSTGARKAKPGTPTLKDLVLETIGSSDKCVTVVDVYDALAAKGVASNRDVVSATCHNLAGLGKVVRHKPAGQRWTFFGAHGVEPPPREEKKKQAAPAPKEASTVEQSADDDAQKVPVVAQKSQPQLVLDAIVEMGRCVRDVDICEHLTRSGIEIKASSVQRVCHHLSQKRLIERHPGGNRMFTLYGPLGIQPPSDVERMEARKASMQKNKKTPDKKAPSEPSIPKAKQPKPPKQVFESAKMKRSRGSFYVPFPHAQVVWIENQAVERDIKEPSFLRDLLSCPHDLANLEPVHITEAELKEEIGFTLRDDTYLQLEDVASERKLTQASLVRGIVAKEMNKP